MRKASLPVKSKEPWISRLQRCSLQDLIALLLPYMFGFAILLVLVISLFDPTTTLFVHGALPEKYQSSLSLALCFLEEVRIGFVILGVVGATLQLQVISYVSIQERLRMILRSFMTRWVMQIRFYNYVNYLSTFLQNVCRHPCNVLQRQQNYRSLRCLQLYMELLNVVNQHLILMIKFLSLGIGIMSGYAAVAHFGDHPIRSIAYIIMFLDSTLFYTLVYDKAFHTPDLISKVKAVFRGNLSRERNVFQRKIMQKRLLSIPLLGIKVGQFHTMERTSTPVFLDYVLSTVVSMLVAYAY